MKCSRGVHEWTDSLDAERCCNPDWKRILIVPGEKLKDVLENPRVAQDGINYSPDGFRFAWYYTSATVLPNGPPATREPNVHD